MNIDPSEIIIGQEVIYLDGNRKSLGRLVSFSWWPETGLQYIIVKPYMEDVHVKVNPSEIVNLIDPRPKLIKFMELFKKN